MERVKTSIPGFDELVDGGIPKNSVVMISGSAGTGKTIFGLQFLVNGARNGEKGLYIGFEEKKKDILEQAKIFGWDIEEFEKKGILKIITFEIAKLHIVNITVEIEKIIKEFEPERLVLDSLSVFEIYVETLTGVEIFESLRIRAAGPALPLSNLLTRRTIMNIVGKLKESEITCIVTSELPEDTRWLSRDTISEFVVDGLIVMHFLGIGVHGNRTLSIRKMRKSKHSEDMHPIEITNRGIVVRKVEEIIR